MIHIISSKSDVKGFIEKMCIILASDKFDINRDFVFQRRRQADMQDDEFTNENTLLTLDYDTSDVVEELKKLTVEDYSESIIDDEVEDLRIFYVFGKKIKKRDVYIKVRIKERSTAKGEFVFCISFHFARYPITEFPYKRDN